MIRNAVFRRLFFALALSSLTAAAASPALAAGNRARTIAGTAAATANERLGPDHPGGPWGMSEAEFQGAGCILSGTVGTLAAYATNANEVVMVVAGGVLAPSTPTLLGIVMLSTVFTSGCAVGALVAPFSYWLYRQAAPSVHVEPPPAQAPR